MYRTVSAVEEAGICITGPMIEDIYDWPGDQGGWVILNWERNSLDVIVAERSYNHFA